MDMNSTPNGSQEQGKKSGNEGLQEKGQAGSEALSLLQVQDSNGRVLDKLETEEFLKLHFSAPKGIIEIYPKEFKLPEVSGFRMGRRV